MKKTITKVHSEDGRRIVGETVTEKHDDGREVHTYYHLEHAKIRFLSNDEWADALFLRGKN